MSLPPTSPTNSTQAGTLEQRLDRLLVIVALLRVDLGGDLELPTRAAGDLDGPVQPLLRGDAAEERQVIAGPLPERVQVAGQAVVDGRLPVGPRQRPALVVGDGDERHLGVLLEQGLLVRGMQPAVQGGDARARVAPQQREVDVVAVEVDDVEAGHVLEDQLQQPDVVRQRLPAVSDPATRRAGRPGPAWPASRSRRWRTG